MKRHLQIQHTALLVALASIYPLQAFAAAGITQFSTGQVTVQRSSGAATSLSRGSNVDSGDLITTGDAGRTQLRFTDGGMISLQPNSQFKITSYSDAAAGKPDSFLVDLARGGMRALTGLIGKRNRENYKVTTSTATIGIRGSGFSMAYNPDGTLGVTTELDAIEVCTQAGCIGLNMGESALVTSSGALPTRVRERAHWNPPNPRRLITARNDDIDTDGKTLTIPKQVAVGLAFAGSGLTTENALVSRLYGNGALAGFQSEEAATTRIVGHLAPNNDFAYSEEVVVHQAFGSLDAGNLMILGSSGAADWENSAGVSTLLSRSAFVAGVPTPSNNFAALAGQRANYAFAVGTPVFTSGNGGPGSITSGSLAVDFLGAGKYVDLSLNVSMPGMRSNELLENTTEVAPATDYALRGSGTAGSGAIFEGVLSVSNAICLYGYAGCGIGKFNGFIGGKQAEHAGVSFSANTGDLSSHGNIGGAALFTQHGRADTPMTQVEEQYHRLSHTFADQDFIDGAFSSITSGEGDVFNFKGSEFINNTARTYIPGFTKPANATSQFGMIGTPGTSDSIGWGYWSSALKTTVEYNNNTTNATIDHFHYVTGKPTSMMPNSGQGTYSLLGGSIPTATNGATTVSGQLLGNSNLNVNFGSGQVTANIFTQFGSTPVTISETMSIQSYNPYLSVPAAQPLSSNSNTFRTCNDGNNTFINGMFTGDNAYRAGLTFGKDNVPGLGNVRGAAIFQRTSASQTSLSN